MVLSVGTCNAASRILSNHRRMGSSARRTTSSLRNKRDHSEMRLAFWQHQTLSLRERTRRPSSRPFASVHTSFAGNPETQPLHRNKRYIEYERASTPLLCPTKGTSCSHRSVFLPVFQSPLLASRNQWFHSIVSNRTNTTVMDAYSRRTLHNSIKIGTNISDAKGSSDHAMINSNRRMVPVHSILHTPSQLVSSVSNPMHTVSRLRCNRIPRPLEAKHFYSVTIASLNSGMAHPTLNRSIHQNRIAITRDWFRRFSSNNGRNPNEPNRKLPGEKPSSATKSTSEMNESEKHKIQQLMTSTVSTVRTNVGSAEATIKRAVEELSTGDLVSVYGIVFLIVVLAGAPPLIKRLQSSDANADYDEIDPDDPVMDLARMIRGEYLETLTKAMTSGDGDDTDEEVDSESSEEDRPKAGSSMGLDRIIADLLNSPQIQEAATNLVTSILQSSQFKNACQLLLRELLKDLLEDPDTLKQVIHLLQHAISDEKIKEAAIQLATDIFGDDRVLDELVTLVQRLGMEKQVMHATQALLVESAHNALNDPEILDHSMEFATDVVGDDVVQQTAGEALYNTMSYAFRPALSVFLALTGVGLIFVSISAIRSLHESPSDAADRAFLNAVESTTSRLLKIIFLPIDFMVACKDALVTLVLFPFRLMSSAVAKAGKLGESLLGATKAWLSWLLHLPFDLLSSLLGRSKEIFDRTVSGAISQITALLGGFRAVFDGISQQVLLRLGVWYCTFNDKLNNAHSLLAKHIESTSTIVVGRLMVLVNKSKSIVDVTRTYLLDQITTLVSFNSFPNVPFQNLVARVRIHYVIWNRQIADNVSHLEEWSQNLVQTVFATCEIVVIKWRSVQTSVTLYRSAIRQHQKELSDTITRQYQSWNEVLGTFAIRVEEILRRILPLR